MSWLLGSPGVNLSSPFKTLGTDTPFLVLTNYSTFLGALRQNQHYQSKIVDSSVVSFTFRLRQRLNLVILDTSSISSKDPAGIGIQGPMHFGLHVVDTSLFLVTFVSSRFHLVLSDTSIFACRFSVYTPATANTNFAGDRFIDAIPDSLNFDSEIQTVGLVNDTSVSTLTSLADRVRVLCNIMQQEEQALDLLAFQFGVLFYQGANLVTDPVTRINLKRSLIQQSYGINCKLGTPGIIQRVISQIYQPAIMQEWWQYGGTHDHFRIITQSTINDPNVINSLSFALFSIIRCSQTFDGYIGPTTTARINTYISVTVYCEMDVVLLPLTART